MKEWENAATHAFAGELTMRHLLRTFELEKLSSALATHRSRGEAAAKFVDGLRGPEPETLAWFAEEAIERFTTVPIGGAQKPFHLWNVERMELDHGFQLEPRDPLPRDLAARPEEAEIPWLRRFSAAVMRDYEHLGRIGPFGYELARFERRQLLARPLPFGRS